MSTRRLVQRAGPLRIEGWVGEDAIGFVGLAGLLKLAWLEPKALELAIDRSKHGTEITVVRGDDSAMISTELLAGPLLALVLSVLEQVMPAPELVRAMNDFAVTLSRLEQLEAATDYVDGASSLEEVLDACVAGATVGLELDRVVLFIRDESRGTLVGSRSKSRTDDSHFERAADGLVIPPTSLGTEALTAAALEPLLPRPPFVLARVEFRGALLGCVFADGLGADQAGLLDRFLGHVASAWQCFRLLHKVESQTRHDAATGLANRRELDARLLHERSRARRTNTPLGFLLVDVDDLAIAGTPPVKAAEWLLRNVGSILREELRAHDLAARFDEHRLSVLLPGAGSFESALVARRIGLAALRKGISLSIGAASFPDDCDHPDNLSDLAQTHLDAATSAGRGRAALSKDGEAIVFADEEDAR